jgi:arylsulfatase A-like enzyme
MRLRSLFLPVLVWAFGLPHAAFSAPPNFLLILTDDHGYGDVSTYHESDVRTPNIDRLATSGMLFTAMRANCTVCSYAGKSYEAIIRGEWKLLRNDPFSPLELYQIKEDPQERNNLAAAQPKILAELATALRAHIQRGGATPWQRP